MTRPPRPFAAEPGGVRLALRLTPRARRDGVEGIGPGADGRPLLHVRLAAPPVEGAANKALIAFLAEALGLRKADITIRSGETARTKILFLTGDAERLVTRLEEWVASGGG